MILPAADIKPREESNRLEEMSKGGGPSKKDASQTRRLGELLRESHDLMDSDCDRAEKLAERAIALAEELDEAGYLGEGLVYLSRAVGNITGAGRASELAERAVDVLSTTDNSEHLAMALNNLGNCRRRDHNPLVAMDCYRRAREIYEALGHERGISIVDNGIGLTYKRMGAYDNAYKVFRRSLERATSIGDDLGRSLVLGNLAEMFLDQMDLETAEEYIGESLKLSLKRHRKIGIAFNLNRLGRLKREKGKPKESEDAYRRALSIWRELGGHRHAVETLCNLAEVLQQVGREDEAEDVLRDAVEEAEDTGKPELLGVAKSRLAEHRLAAHDMGEVRVQLLEALEVLDDGGEMGLEKANLHGMLAACCERAGDYSEAVEHLRRSIELERDFRRNEREQDVVRLRMREAFARSEGQRRELERANRRLEKALERIRTLSGLLPICARCKKIRNDEGYWEQIESYISEHSDTVFSHSFCPECLAELYPEIEGPGPPEGAESGDRGG